MRTKELGNTGVEIPEIGLGTSQYSGGSEPLVRGIEAGATLLDTAERYGTEEVVGEAVRGRRDSVLVATKVSGANVKYDQVIDAANQSLARLGVDCIDLYQVHWQDPSVPIKETMSAMEALVDEGKVKYIGVSNYTADQMKEAQDSLKSNRIVSNQVLYNLADREIEDEVLPYCQENGITVLAFSPLAQGRLGVPVLLLAHQGHERPQANSRGVGQDQRPGGPQLVHLQAERSPDTQVQPGSPRPRVLRSLRLGPHPRSGRRAGPPLRPLLTQYRDSSLISRRASFPYSVSPPGFGPDGLGPRGITERSRDPYRLMSITATPITRITGLNIPTQISTASATFPTPVSALIAVFAVSPASHPPTTNPSTSVT